MILLDVKRPATKFFSQKKKFINKCTVCVICKNDCLPSVRNYPIKEVNSISVRLRGLLRGILCTKNV